MTTAADAALPQLDPSAHAEVLRLMRSVAAASLSSRDALRLLRDVVTRCLPANASERHASVIAGLLSRATPPAAGSWLRGEEERNWAIAATEAPSPLAAERALWLLLGLLNMIHSEPAVSRGALLVYKNALMPRLPIEWVCLR
jgi:hypothetical protein